LLPLFVLVGFSMGGAALHADDARPVVDDSHARPDMPANPALPTLYIVGDSTARRCEDGARKSARFSIRRRSMSSTG